MIDTLKLNLNDCDIYSKCPLTIEPSSYNHANGKSFNDNDLFFCKDSGEIVKGKKAYYNSKYFNLTILPKSACDLAPGATKSTYQRVIKDFDKIKTMSKVKSVDKIRSFHEVPDDKFNSKIFVQFSFPRFNNQNNFKAITKTEQKNILHELEDELRTIGIKTNIFESDISRLDTFSNIDLDQSFSHYSPIFELMKASRKKAIDWNGETYLWKSGEHQLSIYDKIREITSKIKDEKQLSLFSNMNVARIENRFTTKRKFLSKFGFTKTKYLYDDYSEIKKVFVKDVSESIFKYEKNDMQYLATDQIKLQLQNFYDSGKRYWMRNFLTTTGWLMLCKYVGKDSLIEAFESIEQRNIREVTRKGNLINIKSVSESTKRVMKHRLTKLIEEMEFNIHLNKVTLFDKMKSFEELYTELKNKFLKQVA